MPHGWPVQPERGTSYSKKDYDRLHLDFCEVCQGRCDRRKKKVTPAQTMTFLEQLFKRDVMQGSTVFRNKVEHFPRRRLIAAIAARGQLTSVPVPAESPGPSQLLPPQIENSLTSNRR
jgi:hypothetical protein